MKRGAEKQLTKDADADADDEIEEFTDPQGFQKADEAALANRPIRALPKRALGGSRPPSLNGLPPMPANGPEPDKTEVAPQPKFGAFAGFGSGTALSNPFTFAAQPPAVPAPLPPAFESKTAQPTLPSLSPFLGASKVTPPDSGAFSSKPAASPPKEEADTDALKYFKSLRGLNVSFLSAISTAVEKDPFVDVANLVESYKNLRTTIQSEFDRSSHPFTTPAPATTNPAPSFVLKPSSEKSTSLFLMPKPSTGSTETKPELPSTSESATKTGFTFPPFIPPSGSAPTPLPFSITPKPSESSIPSTAPELPTSTSTFAASNTPSTTSSLPPTSGFSSTASSSVEDTTLKLPPALETQGSSDCPTSRTTSSIPTFGSSSVKNVFAATKSSSIFGSSDTGPKPASVFGGSTFGISRTTESSKPLPLSPFAIKDETKDTPSLFGSSATTSSPTPPSIFQPASDKPVSAFGSASPSKGGAFAFGKPGGSIGNPVGFGFGSSSTSGGDVAASGPSSSGFSFAAPSTKTGESLFSPPMSSESTPQPEAESHEEGREEDPAKLQLSRNHDEEGEGEEDEETTHAVRCKVYRLFKSQDQSEWKDLGVGMMRLKRHKDTNVRRVLMRNSSTGRILLNFRISGSLKPTLTKNTVQFIGYVINTPASFNIRLKFEEQAKDLKQAMEREIAAVQAIE